MTPFTRARKLFNDVMHGRFTCACCPGKEFRGHRALNAHHLARHGNYWGGKAGKAMGRKIGKGADAMRRHARGHREAWGLIDRYGRLTSKGRSRPERSEGESVRHWLKRLDHHDRDHEKAEKHHRRADRAAARGNTARQADRHQRAANLRNRWPEREPAPPRARPAPDDGRLRDLLSKAAERANGNGSRPGPATQRR